MAGAAQFLNEEEDVADIDADAALEVRFEHHIGRHGLPVAVKRKADQFALRVQYRRARIAARDVVVRQETGMDLSVRGVESSFSLAGTMNAGFVGSSFSITPARVV